MYIIDESLSDTDFTPAEVVAQAFGAPRRYESITVHHWGSFGQTHMGVVAFFLKPKSPTSCHFVASDSLIHCLVSPLDASWAAGNAYGNATSIHIEARPEATDGDYATVAWLIAHLRSIYGDLPLKPHSEWAATACPGKWDLARLDREARSQTTQQHIQEDEMNQAQDAALGVVFNKINQAPAAGQLASQGDINILLSAVQTLQETILNALGKPTPEPPVTLVKGDKEATVYAWDGGTGFRALDYAEFSALMSSGAALETIPQEKITAAVNQ